MIAGSKGRVGTRYRIPVVDDIKHDFSKMSGTLKMTAPIDFGVHFLEPVVREFCEQYPLMNVQLSLSNIHEDLAGKSYDLGIRIANELPDSDLTPHL